MTAEYTNDVDALEAAGTALRTGEFDVALGQFRMLAEKGQPEALTNLGWMYHTGCGVSADRAKAQNYYELAAVSGSTLARYYLGCLFRDSGNLKESLENFGIAAADNHLPSIYWVGSMYLLGEGDRKDIQKAREYLQRAANRGHAFAQRDLALALLKGTFGERQLVKGFFQWIGAIVKGFVLAMRDQESEKLQ